MWVYSYFIKECKPSALREETSYALVPRNSTPGSASTVIVSPQVLLGPV